jgi:hypothetical protein
VRPAQFPVFVHPAREFLRSIKLRERRESEASDRSDHLGWIRSKLPNKFLYPGVANAKCPAKVFNR